MNVRHINDEVCLYLEQGAVHLRAVTKEGDPTELSVDEAKRLLLVLEELVEQIRRQDG